MTTYEGLDPDLAGIIRNPRYIEGLARLHAAAILDEAAVRLADCRGRT